MYFESGAFVFGILKKSSATLCQMICIGDTNISNFDFNSQIALKVELSKVGIQNKT